MNHDTFEGARVFAGVHLQSIDALRGIAALGVLLWHYQHFYYPEAGAGMPAGQVETQPLFWLLEWFYRNGHFGVQLFWVISGVVFSHMYLRSKRPRAAEFALKRIARLYPLHLVTLLAVAALQAWSWSAFGHFQIYAVNDAYHFLLNLFMASAWGFQKADSFNAPIWSVSVEIIIYAVFYLSLPWLQRWWAFAAALFVGFSLLQGVGGTHIFECGAYFFGGGVAYVLVGRASRRVQMIVLGTCVTILAAAILPLPLLQRQVLPLALCAVIAVLCVDLAMPVRLPKVLLGLGEISYGIYLLHIPVQIAGLCAIQAGWIPQSAIYSPLFLAAFVALVSVLAKLSYESLEVPARVWILARTALRRNGSLTRTGDNGRVNR